MNKLRLLLWTFSGEDDYIIRKCSNKIQGEFAVIGVWVITIILLCGVSTYLFFDSVFHSVAIGIFTSIIWVLMLLNLYLLVLYTISPTILPSKKDKQGRAVAFQHVKIETGALISLIGRLLFLALVAVIMAQPLIVWLFDKLAQHPSGWVEDAYLNNIRLLSSTGTSWLLSILFVVMFWYPIYVKFSVRKDTSFYDKKQQIEKEMILQHYVEFKKSYSEILNTKVENYNEITSRNIAAFLQNYRFLKPELFSVAMPASNISFYESYIDPPFNTEKKKSEKNVGSEKDLLDMLYNNPL